MNLDRYTGPQGGRLQVTQHQPSVATLCLKLDALPLLSKVDNCERVKLRVQVVCQAQAQI